MERHCQGVSNDSYSLPGLTEGDSGERFWGTQMLCGKGRPEFEIIQISSYLISEALVLRLTRIAVGALLWVAYQRRRRIFAQGIRE